MGGILASATGGMLGEHDKDVAEQQANGESTNVSSPSGTQRGGPPAQAPEQAPESMPQMTKPFSDMVTKTKDYKAAGGMTTGDITESVAGIFGGGQAPAPVGTPEIDTYQNAQPQQGYDEPAQPMSPFAQKAMPQLRGFQEYLNAAFNNKV